MQVTRWYPAAALLAFVGQSVAQSPAPAYGERTLGCARFVEAVRSEVRSSYGAVRRTERVGRDGLLVVRARADGAGLAIEAWYDSLAVYREGPEGRAAPDAEGILGGRYRGSLDPWGDYLAEVSPFVPAAIREVFDFGRIPLHFFPPLPRSPISPGREWTDRAGLTIWRLADSATPGGGVARYRWTRRDAWEEGVAAGDSTVAIHRTEVESGSLSWADSRGPLAWESSTVASVEFTGGAGRTEVTQQVRVRRMAEGCAPG
jgi:hypothetical protein